MSTFTNPFPAQRTNPSSPGSVTTIRVNDRPQLKGADDPPYKPKVCDPEAALAPEAVLDLHELLEIKKQKI